MEHAEDLKNNSNNNNNNILWYLKIAKNENMRPFYEINIWRFPYKLKTKLHKLNYIYYQLVE